MAVTSAAATARIAAHLRGELLLCGGHLALGAPTDHSARLLVLIAAALRLALGVSDGVSALVIGLGGDGWSAIGSYDTHGTHRWNIVNDIVIGCFDSCGCGAIWFLEVLDREVNDCATNLHCLVESRQKWRPLFDQDQCSKLALVVLQEELSPLELNFRVAS